MLKDVKCLCGAEFNQVDLTATDGWFTCPKCGCSTKPYVRREPMFQSAIPVFDMKSLVQAVKEQKI
jgi:predicted  nucleic acid-binding Zn-ribbon protein